MMTITPKKLAVVLAGIALLVTVSAALAQTSVSFDQVWQVVSGGGADVSSATFAADGSLSPQAIGRSESSNYRVESGYWYGPVTCVVSGDLNCDCEVDLLDVQIAAGQWRVQDADPEWDAWYDLDRDGCITVVDIMLVVAHWGDTCS